MKIKKSKIGDKVIGKSFEGSWGWGGVMMLVLLAMLLPLVYAYNPQSFNLNGRLTDSNGNEVLILNKFKKRFKYKTAL